MTDAPAPTTAARPPSLVKVMVISQLVVCLVTATLVWVGWHHLDHNISAGDPIARLDPKPVAERDRQLPTEPLNILVLGTDSRAGSGDAIDGEAGCNCSDTTILVHLSADRRSAYGISIPRDALVKPVDCTQGSQYLDTGLVEWNQAYAAGGPACVAEQLQQDFHVYVDHYVVLDFHGFVDMVNAIGGVDVCVPFELSDPTYAKVDFQPGPSVHLDGARALGYFRLRHVLAGTDTGRIRRQQAFISAMTDKLVSAQTLTRPDRLYRFANALTGAVTTDPPLAHVRALVDLARQFAHIGLSHIRFVTLPNALYPGERGDPLWGRVKVLPGAYRLMRLVSQDEPLGSFNRGSVSANTHHHKPASERAKAAAAAAGVCA